MKKGIRIIVTILIIAAIAGLIAWVLTGNKKKNEAKTATVATVSASVAVRVDTVRQSDIAEEFIANGKFAPAQEINFSSETSGRVVRVLVEEGQRISKGQTLAVIKTDNLNVDLQSARESYQNALRDKQRYENAFKSGGVTRQQVDQASLSVTNALAKVEQAQIRITDANIRSSINGVVNKRLIEPGAVLAPGTELFEIVDISTLKLEISVTEAQVAAIKEGDKVKISASVLPGEEFNGQVIFVAAKADASLNFPVTIEVSRNTNNLLRAGMYGIAAFQPSKKVPAITVPRSAFVGGVSSNEVFVVDASNKARVRKVVAGRILGDRVEVSRGLEENEKVIVSGQINLAEGTAVNVIR
ncbi:MAG: efflux RND transporter periplasmic adaptor subunit [Chitinophagaceae bacterium]|nr:MAG: efflux RND transporter periplasmic adaptor subunit [Chitinophagaceae bacterium]